MPTKNTPTTDTPPPEDTGAGISQAEGVAKLLELSPKNMGTSDPERKTETTPPEDGLSDEDLAVLAKGDDPDAEPEGTEEEGPDADAEVPESGGLPDLIEVEGEKFTREELKNSILRQRDYTKKTMQLAEERKAFEGERESAKTARDQYGAALQKLNDVLGKISTPDFEKLEKELPPEEFAKAVAKHQLEKEKRAALESELQRVQDEKEAEEREKLGQYVAGERQRLAEVLPEFADDAKAADAYKRLVTHYGKQGVTKEELNAIIDHRMVVVLHKAMQFDEIQSRLEKIRSRKKQPPGPVVTPNAQTSVTGSRETRNALAARKAMEKATQTGSERDAIAAIKALGL